MRAATLTVSTNVTPSILLMVNREADDGTKIPEIDENNRRISAEQRNGVALLSWSRSIARILFTRLTRSGEGTTP